LPVSGCRASDAVLCRPGRPHARRRLSPNDAFRVVELTPPGSKLIDTDRYRDSHDETRRITRKVHSRRHDLEAGRRGADCSRTGGSKSCDPATRHPLMDWDRRFRTRADPGRRDYASFADFSERMANSWVLQERGYAIVTYCGNSIRRTTSGREAPRRRLVFQPKTYRQPPERQGRLEWLRALCCYLS